MFTCGSCFIWATSFWLEGKKKEKKGAYQYLIQHNTVLQSSYNTEQQRHSQADSGTAAWYTSQGCRSASFQQATKSILSGSFFPLRLQVCVCVCIFHIFFYIFKYYIWRDSFVHQVWVQEQNALVRPIKRQNPPQNGSKLSQVQSHYITIFLVFRKVLYNTLLIPRCIRKLLISDKAINSLLPTISETVFAITSTSCI